MDLVLIELGRRAAYAEDDLYGGNAEVVATGVGLMRAYRCEICGMLGGH